MESLSLSTLGAYTDSGYFFRNFAAVLTPGFFKVFAYRDVSPFVWALRQAGRSSSAASSIARTFIAPPLYGR